MKKAFYIPGFVALLTLVYFLGPTPATPNYDDTIVRDVSSHLDLTDFLTTPEGVKENNQTRCIHSGSPTPYVVLYLHGFSASPEEGSPTLEEVCKHFGWNAVAPRLYDHGLISDEPLKNFRADSAWMSAVRGLELAKAMGDSIIVMSTSTGGALATRIAQLEPSVAAAIYYSPNVMPADPLAFLLNNPWGGQIARMVLGSNYRDVEIHDDYYEAHWNRYYRIESLPNMQEIVESGFTKESIQSLTMPVMIGAWYVDEKEQDDVVSVPAMREFFQKIPSSQKQFVEFDANTHVIANGHYNPRIRSVIDSSISFLEKSGFTPLAQDTLIPQF